MQSNPAATAAAPVRNRAWTREENAALLAACEGSVDRKTAAFWESALAQYPLLAARGTVRCHSLSLCHVLPHCRCAYSTARAMLARSVQTCEWRPLRLCMRMATEL